MKTIGIEIDQFTGHLFHDVEAYIICLSKIKEKDVEVVFVQSIPEKYFVDYKNYKVSKEYSIKTKKPNQVKKIYGYLKNYLIK